MIGSCGSGAPVGQVSDETKFVTVSRGCLNASHEARVCRQCLQGGSSGDVVVERSVHAADVSTPHHQGCSVGEQGYCKT